MSTSTGKSQFIPQIYIAGHTPSGRAAFGADFDHALMRNPWPEKLMRQGLARNDYPELMTGGRYISQRAAVYITLDGI
jgi:hypothetical protein